MILRTPRFGKKIDPLFSELNSSIETDFRLYKQDIRQSLAHAKALLKAGVVNELEFNAISSGLKAIESEIDKGTLIRLEDDEDIHMLIERKLSEIAGEAGEKLHTARSRNDQVATDLRLYLKEKISGHLAEINGLQQTLIDIAEKKLGAILPGYTHLQRAQPVLLSHHLLAHFFALARDFDRFSDCLKRVDLLPAGSGAMAGVSYDIDRDLIGKELGFAAILENSLDAVSDRDFALEYLSCAALLSIHLSRIAEEIILWSSSEFGFIEIDDSFASGSSIMPQKKNPDAAELIRGKTGRVIGALVTLLSLMKGLPLTYNKDLQEDKAALFDCCDTLDLIIPATNKLLNSVTFSDERMRSFAGEDFTASTDVADYLVSKGMPFRRAHELTATLVKFCLDSSKKFEDLTIDELNGIEPAFDQDFFEVIKIENVVNSKISSGGTSRKRVEEEIEKAKGVLVKRARLLS